MGKHSVLTRGPVYEMGGVVYYRAHSLGGCARMLALARQGFDPLPAGKGMQDVFQAGIEAERQVWAKGIVQGSAQEYVEMPISETIRVAGHLDCWDAEVAEPRVRFDTGRVYEIKSQSEGEWKPIEKSALWGRYKFQIGVYMWATGLPLTVIRVMRRKDGTITHEERQDYTTSPVSLAEIRAKVFQVELLARRDLTDVKCEKIEYPCPFYYTHGDDREDVVEREEVDDPAAVVLADQYQAAKLVATAANARVKASRQALLAYMGERERLGLSDGTLLTRYKVDGRHVEYDAKEYWALKVTARREGESGTGGRAGVGGKASG